MPPDFILKLADAATEISFVDNAGLGYELIDGTLDISDPELRQSSGSNYSLDRSGVSEVSYSGRTISFSYRVRGATLSQVMARISAVERLLQQARSPLFLAGGQYDGRTRFSTDYDVGTAGVRLVLAAGESYIAFPNIETYEETSLRKTYAFSVIHGSLRIVTPFSASGIYQSGTQVFVREVSVEIQCEPFAYGPSTVVGRYADDPGFLGFMGTPTALSGTTRINRMIIAGSDIPGDAPAPTRIMTRLSGGTSIIIARDPGLSLLNSTTVPVRSGGTSGHLLVDGNIEQAIGVSFVVRVTTTGTPDRARVFATGVSSTEFNIQALTPIPVTVPRSGGGSDTIYLMFTQATGHTLNQQWAFSSNQSFFYPNATKNVYSSYAGYMSAGGTYVGGIDINVPSGVRKNYKIMANLSESTYKRTEYRMSVSFGFIPYEGTTYTWTQEVFMDWVMPVTHLLTTVDLGPLDLTARGCPALQNPSSIARAQIKIYARGTEALSEAHNVNIGHCFVVPASDPNAYIRAAWVTDTMDGWESYSNYDESNPYITETTASYWHGAIEGFLDITAEIGSAAPLDATWIGRHITLIPGVTNTIYFLPLFNSGGDYRKGYVTNSQTGPTYVACRPKYLFVG